jgi:hypothetical protein
MANPSIDKIDQAIRRFRQKRPEAPSTRRPRARPQPASVRRSGHPRPAPEIDFPAELDVEAIGRMAMRPPEGMTPDELIERALRAAGVHGSWSSSREYREVWYLCVLAREAALEQESLQA